MPLDVVTHQTLGLDQPTPERVNDRSNADIEWSIDHPDDAQYQPCAEAYPQSDLPRGQVQTFKDWDLSRIFPDTLRDLWVYQSPQVDSDSLCNLIVFQDGAGYLSRRGAVRATQVLDTMCGTGELAPTVGVFINPGRPPGTHPMFHPEGFDEANRQRSFEYDSLTPDYGHFLLDEVLPFVAERIRGSVHPHPERRVLAGISSGGICAFNAAWQAPEHFAGVLSHCGSYTNIRGGHNLQYLVRTTPRKPLRIFLQSGAQDAQTLYGNWPLANQTMSDSLRYAGYDHRFVYGAGGHTLRHGGSLFAEALRWLWRESDEPG